MPLIEGADILKHARVIEVPIEKIRLDTGNVRFQHLSKRLTEDEVFQFIWREPDTIDLYNQILTARGVYQMPVLDKNYVVIEGNRRVACLRRLKEKAHKDELPSTIPVHQFDKIKCQQLPPEASPAEIDLFLAATHVRGKKEWDAFNKAKHIYNLHNVHSISYDNIAKALGMGKVTVIRMVDVYVATGDYGMRFSDQQWYRKFSYFDELYKKRALKEFVKDPANVKKFAEWVYEKKFKDHRHVRDLSKVLLDKEATQTLERTNLAEALEIVEEKDPTINSPEFKKIRDAIEAIRTFSRKELIKSVSDESRVRLLKTLKSEVDGILNDIASIRGSGK